MKKNKMNKGNLAKATDVSDYYMRKLYREEPVSLEGMVKFCKMFHCDIGDLMEVIEED